MPRTTPMRTLTTRVPEALYQQLVRLGGQGGIGGVVREALERGLAGAEAPTTAADPKTRELLVAISRAADLLEEAYGSPWHEDAFESTALGLAIGVIAKFIGHPEAKGTYTEPLPAPKPGGLIARMSGAKAAGLTDMEDLAVSLAVAAWQMGVREAAKQ